MFKKFLSGIIAAAMAASVGAVMPTAGADSYEDVNIDETFARLLGDTNVDNVVNVYDLLILEKYVEKDKSVKDDPESFLYWDRERMEEWKNEEPFSFVDEISSDINDDGRIDETDLGYLRDYLLNKPTPFTTSIGAKKLSKGAFLPEQNGKELTDEFTSAHMKFGIDLFKGSYAKKSENALVSPLSVAMALTMAANGAKGETLAQIEKVLGGGMSVDELDQYLSYYKASLENNEIVDIELANSIWYREKSAYNVKEDFLNKNMECLNAVAYEAPFNDDTVDDINNWVCKNTKGMIQSLLDKELKPLDPLEMCLINTVYFDAEWDRIYTGSSPMTFTNINGTESKPEGLYSHEYFYLESDNYTGFKKEYKDGRYSFVGILPDEGIDFNQFVEELDPEELRKTVSSPIVSTAQDRFELHVSMPMFKEGYGLSISEILQDMGIKDAFQLNKADFSGMTDMGGLFVSDVYHKTVIDVNKTGTTAAAVTAVMMAGAAIPPRIINVDMDRPFVYMIYDNEADIPLFIGSVTNL